MNQTILGQQKQLTDRLNQYRDEYYNRNAIKSLGAKAGSSISSKTDCLDRYYKRTGRERLCLFESGGEDMDNRILIKVSVLEHSITIKTISRGLKKSHNFYILKERILELADCKWVVVSDRGSFAELSLETVAEGLILLQITFSWLSVDCSGGISGRKEDIKVPFDRFYRSALSPYENVVTEWKMLSLTDKTMPQIEFESRHALHNVVQSPLLRKKLGKFLATHFQWPRSQRIVLYDDGYSDFYFQEYRGGKLGICGGVILHGTENPRTAYYGIHT